MAKKKIDQSWFFLISIIALIIAILAGALIPFPLVLIGVIIAYNILKPSFKKLEIGDYLLIILYLLVGLFIIFFFHIYAINNIGWIAYILLAIATAFLSEGAMIVSLIIPDKTLRKTIQNREYTATVNFGSLIASIIIIALSFIFLGFEGLFIGGIFATVISFIPRFPIYLIHIRAILIFTILMSIKIFAWYSGGFLSGLFA